MKRQRREEGIKKCCCGAVIWPHSLYISYILLWPFGSNRAPSSNGNGSDVNRSHVKAF